MTSMARKTIIDALVTQIDTEVDAFNLVADEATHREELSPENFPVAKIKEGPTTPGGFVTKTEQLFLQVAVKILCDVDSEDDDLRDMVEATIDAVNTDTTLNGTCIVCNFNSVDEPQFWPLSSYKTTDVFFDIHYWRDIA